MRTKVQTKVQANTTPTFTPVLQKPRPLSDSYHHILRRRDHQEPNVQDPGLPGTPAFIDPGFGHDFSRVWIYNNDALPIQAKLRINEPGDVYEEEADRVADAVMRMEVPGVQRQVEDEEEEEETLQAKPLAEDITPLVQRQVELEEEEELQAKATSGRISEVNPNLESHIQSLKGGGQPLSENDRAFFEPRFGHDFSRVRVHNDANAARAVNARPFTVGQDVVFGAGQYTTGTNTGQRLMAHELAHVVQQQKLNKTHLARHIDAWAPGMNRAEKRPPSVPEEILKGINLSESENIAFDNVPIKDIYNPVAENYSGYLNTEYWEKMQGRNNFKLIPGKSASKGIEKIFEGPTRLECKTMAVAIMYRAILKTLGDNEFNNRFNFKNMKIERKPKNLDPYLKNVPTITSETKDSMIQKGDFVVFKNHPKYIFKHPDGAWQAENAFCIGKDSTGKKNKYKGFGINDDFTEEKIVEMFKSVYDADRTELEREKLAKYINVHFEQLAFPVDDDGNFKKKPTDGDLDAWIDSHPRVKLKNGHKLDDYHTGKFPKTVKKEEIPGLILDTVKRIEIPSRQ